MKNYEVTVLISACDDNADGLIDPEELEYMRSLARRAISKRREKVRGTRRRRRRGGEKGKAEYCHGFVLIGDCCCSFYFVTIFTTTTM